MNVRRLVNELDRIQEALRMAKDICRDMRDAEIALAHRSADQAHRECIIDEVADDIRDYTNSNCGAIQIAEAIAAGRIRHLTINY